MNSKSFSSVQRSRGFERDYCGIARVIIPKNSDRDKYIRNCYQTSTLSIVARENLDIVHDVDIDPELMQRVSFPDTDDILGSTLVFLNVPYYNRPIIVAVLNNKDEMTHLEEGEFAFRRESEDGYIAIQGKSKGSQINITTNSTNGKGGIIRINVGNLKDTGKLDVVVQGAFLLNSLSGDLSFRDSFSLTLFDNEEGSKRTVATITNDSYKFNVKESTSGFDIVEDAFNIGAANEKAVLANALKTFMESLIDTVASQTVVTSLGPQPLVNAAGITALKSNIDSWISNYFNIE